MKRKERFIEDEMRKINEEAAAIRRIMPGPTDIKLPWVDISEEEAEQNFVGFFFLHLIAFLWQQWTFPRGKGKPSFGWPVSVPI